MRPRLWNPNVAGILSILLNPLFGPVTHGLNWRALGHERDAKISFVWAGGLLVAILIILVVAENPPFLLFCALVLAWHFAHGRKQIAFAKNLPGGYQKRNMWIAAGVALGATVAAFIMLTVIGAVLGSGLGGLVRDGDASSNSGEIATMSDDGSPSDQLVLEAASFLDVANGEDFKRGAILESTGGNLPIGTLIYPIKLKGYPLPLYFSRDEFDDWAFSIGDIPRLIPVKILTEADKRKQEEDAARREADKIKAQRANVEASRVAREMGEKKELERQVEREEMRKKQEQERANDKIEEERANLEHKRRVEEERAQTYENLRLAGERQSLENDLRDEAIKAGKGTTIVPTKREIPTETGDTPTQDKPIGLAEAKAELAALDTQIASEQKRWADATFVVNKLTNFRKSPVEKNSPAHHQSYAALKIIQDVEQKAPAMKADKVRLEKLIEELSPKK